MSILIRTDKCRNCGRCIEACPGNLIQVNPQGKVWLRHPEECWGCTSCLKECQFEAIYFYLGADIGGRGSLMHTRREGDLCHWIVEPPDGRPVVITVDRRSANKY